MKTINEFTKDFNNLIIFNNISDSPYSTFFNSMEKRFETFIEIENKNKTLTINNLYVNYEKILEVLRKISDENILFYQRQVSKLKDLELISLVFAAEYMGIDSENLLFRQIPKSVKSNIERSVYNR